MSAFQDRVLRFVAGVGVLAAAGAAAAGGVALVANSATVTQPTGSVLAWEIVEPGTNADPFVVSDGTSLEVRVVGVRTGALPVSVSAATGGGAIVADLMRIVDGVGEVSLPTDFSGCGLVTIDAAGIGPLRTVVSDGGGACPTELTIGVFTELGISAGGAPTGTITELLIYLRDVSAAADTTDNLSAAYRECLEKVDAAEVNVCLASLLYEVERSYVARDSATDAAGF